MERKSEQYSLARILGIWALATAPMGILGWIFFPLLAPDPGPDPLAFGEPAGYSFDAIFGSQEILARLQGAWWFLVLFVFQAAFNTILGEEFLFRGVLLPRMKGVFGRWSWVANGVLFGLYHVHQPWGIPNGIHTGLLYSFPAYRYRSTWMSIILHSAQSVYFAFLVLGVVLGLA
jgi:uncharacterized protein